MAVDPHKWLYAPLEAGCTLVRDRNALRDAFTQYRPSYYKLLQDAEEAVNYFEYGPENSRGFRALKIWLAIRQVGREGYAQMIGDDIRLSETLFELAAAHAELQAFRQGLSIATFRYVPRDLKPGDEKVEEYLNRLNSELLERLQKSGKAFLTNAVIDGAFVLRACIVNFRTSLADIRALPGIITHLGAELDSDLRPTATRPNIRQILQKAMYRDSSSARPHAPTKHERLRVHGRLKRLRLFVRRVRRTRASE